METHLRQPEELTLDSPNMAETWRRWKRKWTLYSTAIKLSTKTKIVQSSTFLDVIGPAADDLVTKSFVFAETDDKDDVTVLIAKFDEKFKEKKNITMERHRFNTRMQQPGESIDAYVTDLRAISNNCEFGTLQDGLIKDRIVVGITNNSVRAQMLQKSALTLEQAIDMCKSVEQTQAHMSTLNDQTTASMDQVRTHQTTFLCRRCGKTHQPRSCPAFGQTCSKCGRKNHFASKCRTQQTTRNQSSEEPPAASARGGQRQNKGRKKKKKKKPQTQVDVESASEDDSRSDYETLFVGDLKDDTCEYDTEWHVDLRVNGSGKHRYKIDTGAKCNVMTQKTYKGLAKRPKLMNSGVRLVSFSNHKVKPIGKCRVLVEYNKKYHTVEFQVVRGNYAEVLGLKTCMQMNLVQRVDAVDSGKQNKKPKTGLPEKYKDVFDGLGCLEGKYHINLIPNVQPVVHAPRRVPVALRGKVKNELKRMETLGVIRKCTTPSTWVNSMVTVMKPDKSVRICLDPKDLNMAIEREHYPMRTIDDITDKLTGAKYFSKLDANCGYWQVQLDDESAKLTAFNSPFGRFEYLRLPFGVSNAPEVFMKKMSETFDDLDGVEVIMDDLLIYGSSQEEHDKNLENVMKRCQEKNIKLNIKKCQFKVQEVKYMGHTVTAQGLKPDDNKIEAIKAMQSPKDKKGLQEILGMVTFLARWVPNLSTVTAPMREMLENDVIFEWGDAQEKSFKKVKELLTSAPVLKYYDVTKPVQLTCDSSQYGLGSCLLQEGKPVGYASKSLTDAQTRWSQMEKELLAIVEGCEKFHYYIFGREVEVLTDHKPLEMILRKPLHKAPLRLQKLLLRLQKYNPTVRYVKGKDLHLAAPCSLHVADALSRNCLPNTNEQKDDIQVCMVQNLKAQMSLPRINELKEETEKDNTLKKLKETIQKGWPDEKQELDQEVKPYWDMRAELTIEENIIFKDDRAVIPKSMRKFMLKEVHKSHLGIVKCKKLARDLIFWPGMTSEIADVVSKCETCNSYCRSQNPREQMLSPETPKLPWEKVGSDLFEHNGKTYIVLVDYYSSYIEVEKLSNATSQSIIRSCKQNFGRHGIPKELITDGGPCYTSELFKKFTKDMGIEHTISSPKYPQGNAKAESAVKICKNMLIKAQADGTDFQLSLLQYRNTPLDDIDASPAQLLMGRRTRTQLPTKEKLLKPKTEKDVPEKLDKKKEIQKRYYDRGTRQLKKLKKGDLVRVKLGKNAKQLTMAKVIKETEQPRSYIIESDGVHYRRNRRDLFATNEDPVTSNQTWELSGDENDMSNQKSQTSKHSGPYRTRSGRISKTPMRYHDQF